MLSGMREVEQGVIELKDISPKEVRPLRASETPLNRAGLGIESNVYMDYRKLFVCEIFIGGPAFGLWVSSRRRLGCLSCLGDVDVDSGIDRAVCGRFVYEVLFTQPGFNLGCVRLLILTPHARAPPILLAVRGHVSFLLRLTPVQDLIGLHVQ